MSRLLKFSTPTCGQCKLVSARLKKENISFEEVDCTTEEGEKIAQKYHVTHVPILIRVDDNDNENLRLNNLSDILKNVSKFK